MITTILATVLLLLPHSDAQRSVGAAIRNSQLEAAAEETAHLVAAASGPAVPVSPGSRVSLVVEVRPKPKMHVYAPGQKDYIPVSLTLEKSADYAAHPPAFPPAEKFLFKALNEMQLVYSKPFRIVSDVTIARTPEVRRKARAAGGTVTVAGTLRYQACDDVICYPPKNVPVKWTILLK
jgi:hypothetical protein